MAGDYMFLPGASYGNKTPTQSRPKVTSSGGGGGSYGYSAPDYYGQLQAMIAEMQRQQMEANIAAIRSQVEQATNKYQGQLDALPGTYQPLKNQSEVERYKAMRALRETQANRGALDSGAGRQENLDMSTNYSNRLNQINLQEQAEADAIRRAIADVRSQGDLQIANAQSTASVEALRNNIALLQEQMQAKQSQAQSRAKSVAAGTGINTDIGKNTGETSSTTGLSSAGKSYYQSLQMSGADDATIAKYISNAVKQGIISSADAQILAERYGFGTEYK
ncbi:hypothetical protein [Holdemania massiliensis]|uniref:hypothetical protein n=1 Tax=Holdemania massiliensis TaxID=1468449 RepID=UPI0020687DC6|nr:hypothetical protein [Holdemania massiliensis]DAR49029.1 MAG TPA: hypothetical protein [Caudoviricetes sp.]